MISSFLRRPLRLSAWLVFAATGVAAEPAIIAKARAFLGTDAALDSVRSVHFTGSVVSTDPADPTKQTRATIEIIAQKPDQQRVVAKSEKAVETTVLDGYEGWQRTQDASDPKAYRQVVFRPDAVKRLSAQTWENLSFFRGIERRGGHVEDLGTAQVDGLTCQKLAFVHAPGIAFYRYFDVATGRLVQTETDDGGITREEGEKMVKGIRFPERMKMVLKGPNNQTQQVTITFDSIQVNESFPPALFRVPSPAAP